MFNDSPWVVEESDLSFFRLIIFWGGSVSFLSSPVVRVGVHVIFLKYLLHIALLLVLNFSAVFIVGLALLACYLFCLLLFC